MRLAPKLTAMTVVRRSRTIAGQSPPRADNGERMRRDLLARAPYASPRLGPIAGEAKIPVSAGADRTPAPRLPPWPQSPRHRRDPTPKAAARYRLPSKTSSGTRSPDIRWVFRPTTAAAKRPRPPKPSRLDSVATHPKTLRP